MPKDEFVDEDPMELVGVVMPGEPGMMDAMATAIVEEYVLLGWDEPRLMTLFVNPLFLATHRIYRQKGEAYVRDLVRSTCAKFRIPARPDETALFAPTTYRSVRASIGLETDPQPDHHTSFVALE
ncbi:MAG: hypothetical protein IT329_14565 [Caldilineaceae bacterium]|nr:hypothetical protein [Caldilineaceae bacterium]